MTTIATTGGGTAGHVLPCIALIPDLKNHFNRIIHVGGDGMEKELIPSVGIEFFRTKSIKFDRAHILKNLKIPFVLSAAVKEAKDILSREKVDVVFGKGGYCSLPTIIGAKQLGIPVAIHESDYKLGLANKVGSYFADLILTSFPETKGGLFVGNPIRKEIFDGNALAIIREYNLSPLKKTLLFFGGSSGASVINDVVFKIAKTLVKEFNVLHVIGKKEKRRLFLDGYVSIPYANDIQNLYATADVIIMRGGANSLGETTALGKRVICIPLPKSKYSRGDQVDNAISYVKRGLINLLPQNELSEERLIKEIHSTLSQKERPVNRDTPNGEIVKKLWNLLVDTKNTQSILR